MRTSTLQFPQADHDRCDRVTVEQGGMLAKSDIENQLNDSTINIDEDLLHGNEQEVTYNIKIKLSPQLFQSSTASFMRSTQSLFYYFIDDACASCYHTYTKHR